MIELTATEVAAEIARGAASAEDYTRACLERIAAIESEVQAFAHIDAEHALAQARALDRHKSDGGRIGLLHGVPVGIKDIFDTADYPTECGSPALAGRRTETDATAVRLLREAGAVIVGKTVSTEFAYFHPGKTKNPRDLSRTPGGSSSGSAAAVAAGMVPLAIGSQTNGSMIRPASFCGVFGVKPSHGLISRAGALNLSRTLDHVGAFARSVEDLALILDVLVATDAADPNSRAYASPRFRATAAEQPQLPPRFAFVRTPMWDHAESDTRSAIEDLAKEIGAQEIDLPADCGAAPQVLRAIMSAEMAFNLGHFVDQGIASKEFTALITEGRTVTATQYQAARRDAKRFAEDMMYIFEQYADAIITPSAAGIAPLGIEATGNPLFCSLWTLIGYPALNMPLVANADGLPIGVQLIGAPARDERLLRTARALISSLG